MVLKNAEMSFNFGSSPFKYAPVEGYVAWVEAPGESVVENSKTSSGSGGAPQRKLVANAPQAIIIEVQTLPEKKSLLWICRFT